MNMEAKFLLILKASVRFLTALSVIFPLQGCKTTMGPYDWNQGDIVITPMGGALKMVSDAYGMVVITPLLVVSGDMSVDEAVKFTGATFSDYDVFTREGRKIFTAKNEQLVHFGIKEEDGSYSAVNVNFKSEKREYYNADPEGAIREIPADSRRFLDKYSH